MNLTAPITMQDVRLFAGEGQLDAAAVLSAVNAVLRQRADRTGYAIVPKEATGETLRKIMHAIDYTPMSDGDPIGVALAENERIADLCNTADEIRAELNKVLWQASLRAYAVIIAAAGDEPCAT
jgi:hypothetical protein